MFFTTCLVYGVVWGLPVASLFVLRERNEQQEEPEPEPEPPPPKKKKKRTGIKKKRRKF